MKICEHNKKCGVERFCEECDYRDIRVSKAEFYHMITLILNSNPWPVSDPLTNKGSIVAWANRTAKDRGFNDYLDAYYKLSEWYENLLN